MKLKKITIVTQRSPYATQHAQEALDLVLAASAFSTDICLVFLDDGVLQLTQQEKSFSEKLQVLELYDINTLYASGTALQQRSIQAHHLIPGVTVLGDHALANVLDDANVIMSF